MERYEMKRDLLENHREDVMQIQDGVEEAAFEALELLINVLPKRYPTMFKKIDETTIQNLVTSDTWDTARGASTWEKYHPLQVMSLLATEDFFIMQTDAEGWSSLRAGVVCFPGMLSYILNSDTCARTNGWKLVGELRNELATVSGKSTLGRFPNTSRN
jgi:hypothetical protein